MAAASQKSTKKAPSQIAQAMKSSIFSLVVILIPFRKCEFEPTIRGNRI